MTKNFSITCSKDNLIHIREFINDSLKIIGLRTTDMNLITLAIDEICANIIIHGNNCDTSNTLNIIYKYDSTSYLLSIEIRDQGEAFDYKTYSEPELQKVISEKRKGGIGLMLVRKIMDSVECTSNKDYNSTKLTKKINPQSLAS